MHQMHAEPLTEFSRAVADIPEGPVKIECRESLDTSIFLS